MKKSQKISKKEQKKSRRMAGRIFLFLCMAKKRQTLQGPPFWHVRQIKG